MKSLGKLKINSAKILNNEELINLKGGGYGNGCNGTCDSTCTYGSSQGSCTWHTENPDGNQICLCNAN